MITANPTEQDVILTVFSTSVQAPAKEWVKKYFPDDAIVLVVPGNGGGDFRAKAVVWGKTGDLFQAALNFFYPKNNIKIRRRILVTFSVGWSFFDTAYSTYPEQLDKLDAYLLLDGCHTEKLDHWTNFATRAARLEKLMFMAHSSIKPPFVSSTITNTKIFQTAKESASEANSGPKVSLELPDYLTNTALEKPITIKVGAAPPLPTISKTWAKDPLLDHEGYGGLIRLHYDGNDRPDHVYIAWYVQEKLYHYLGDWLKFE